MKTAWITMMAVLLLTGCAPAHETQYTFLPPQETEGQVCVARCSATNSACLREADQQAAALRETCDLEARQDYELCLLRTPGGDAREPCEQRRCAAAADTATCDTAYRACFTACGGFIESRQVCTFNC